MGKMNQLSVLLSDVKEMADNESIEDDHKFFKSWKKAIAIEGLSDRTDDAYVIGRKTGQIQFAREIYRELREVFPGVGEDKVGTDNGGTKHV